MWWWWWINPLQTLSQGLVLTLLSRLALSLTIVCSLVQIYDDLQTRFYLFRAFGIRTRYAVAAILDVVGGVLSQALIEVN